MKKTLVISLLLLLASLAFGWDLNRQAQFPTNFYALDRVGTTLWAAGYVGGFAKSTDSGETWEFVPNPAYDPVTPAYKDINDIDFYDELHGVMVSADGLVAVTSDGGTTWAVCLQTPGIFGTDDVNACSYLPDGKIWVAGWNGKIAYSTDHGANWTQQTSGLTDQIYSISVNSAGLGFCAMHRGTPNQSKLLATTDYGANWTVQNLTITGNPHLYKVRQSGSTVLLAGSLGYIGVSNDNGANWTHHINAGGTSTNMQDIVLEGLTGYAGGWNSVLLKTTDGWASFSPVTNDFGLYFEGLNIMPSGSVMAAGWNGAIALSSDQGATWTDKVANALDLFGGSVVDENIWYLAGDKGYLIKTADGGQTFTRLHIPGNFDIYYACWFKTALEGWVTGKTTGKIFHTTDGGSNWTTFTVPGVTSAQSYLKLFFASDLVGYALGSNNIHAKTADGGNTWTMLNGTGLGTSVLYSCYFKDENNGFAGSSAGQLYITQNGGQSWAPITVGSTGTSVQIRDIWFKNAATGVLVNSAGEIFYTATGGLTATDWTAATESCLDDMNGVWSDEDGVFWAAGHSSDNVTTNIGNSWAIVKSIDNGATWTQETFPSLTFNSTRFMGITGATGRAVAYGKNNVVVSAELGGGEPPVYATDLFISEYVEGSSYQKALEIFNGTGLPVDLSAYSLKKQTNGAGDFGSELILSGTLAHNDCYVIVNNSSGGTNLADQPFVDLATSSQVVNFNGNDAVALYHNGVQTDVVGIVNDVSMWGQDQTWVRNATVASPTTAFNLADWTVFPNNTFTDLGIHTFTPSGGATAAAPTFTPPAGLYTENVAVSLSTTTPGATIYYTTNGDTPTTSSNEYQTSLIISMTTTIKAIAVADGYNNSSVATAVYSFPIIASSIAALRNQTPDNTTAYQLNSDAVLTFQQTYRNQKWLQDVSAGIMIDDYNGVIATAYNLGDALYGLVGKLYEYGGMLEFIPLLNAQTVSSTGNIITPEVVTLSQLTASFEDYESELVKVMGVTFTGAAGSFVNGTVYPISDTSGSYNFRTTFYDVDYIGQAVPTVPMDLVGIPNSRTDGDYFSSRFAADIQTPQGNVAAPTFTPAPGVYYEGIDVYMSTTTAGASIYYTLDGSTPTQASTLYTGPFDINTTTTVKAIAVFNNESSAVAAATYTFPVEVENLAALRQQAVGTTIYKVVGEVFITFKQTFRNQKWLQDSSAGIMIDDFNGIVTGTYNVGDGIAGICGTLVEFGNQLEFHPTVTFPAVSSMGVYLTPQIISMAEFASNFEAYESELVLLAPATFNTPETTFTNGTVYPISDGTESVNFRTSFYDVDYIGTTITITPMVLVGIANSRTDGIYFTSRNLADMTPFVLEPPSLLTYEIQDQNDVLLSWAPGDIPVEGAIRAWEGLTALNVYRGGALIATLTDFVQYEMASYLDEDLPAGEYNYCVTNVYYGQHESFPSNAVTVNITGNEDEVMVPAEATALLGNYPNPFNPRTVIKYSVKDPAPVSLAIYNLKGERVRTLVSETKSNGFYGAAWDGKDDSGKAVTSGVYLYRLQAGGYNSTRRMMLMK